MVDVEARFSCLDFRKCLIPWEWNCEDRTSVLLIYVEPQKTGKRLNPLLALRVSTLAIIIIINEKVQIRECQEARTRASQAQASSKGLVQLKGQEA